jgi:hypothetical protein
VPSTLLMMFNFSDTDNVLCFIPTVDVAMIKGGLRKMTGRVHYYEDHVGWSVVPVTFTNSAVSWIYFLELLMQLICTQWPHMFHNHATQWRVYITADKLHLNKLSQLITHLSHVKLCGSRQRVPELLQMLLAALVSTTSQAVAKCRLMQVMKQLGSASSHPIQFFGCRDKRPCNGEWLAAVSASWKKHDTSATAARLHYSAVWNVAEVTFTARHLNTVF